MLSITCDIVADVELFSWPAEFGVELGTLLEAVELDTDTLVIISRFVVEGDGSTRLDDMPLYDVEDWGIVEVTLSRYGEVERVDTAVVGVIKQLQAELILDGLPPQPSIQVGMAPPGVCVYVGQKVVANEK